MLSEHGPSTLFRGLATSCGREGLFTAGCLGLAPVLAEKLHSDFGVESKLGSFLGACCAGMVAATLSHPLDTIKTCLQGDVAQEKYKSMPETYSTLMKEGGVGRFYRGYAYTLIRAFPVAAAIMPTFELLEPSRNEKSHLR